MGRRWWAVVAVIVLAMAAGAGLVFGKSNDVKSFRNLQTNPDASIPGMIAYVEYIGSANEKLQRCAYVIRAFGGMPDRLMCAPSTMNLAWTPEGLLAVSSVEPQYPGTRVTETISVFDPLTRDKVDSRKVELDGTRSFAPPPAEMVGLATVCDSDVKLRDNRPGAKARDVVEYESRGQYWLEGRYSSDQAYAAGIDSDGRLLLFRGKEGMVLVPAPDPNHRPASQFAWYENSLYGTSTIDELVAKGFPNVRESTLPNGTPCFAD